MAWEGWWIRGVGPCDLARYLRSLQPPRHVNATGVSTSSKHTLGTVENKQGLIFLHLFSPPPFETSLEGVFSEAACKEDQARGGYSGDSALTQLDA